MASPNILALVGAVTIAIGFGAFVEAANRQGGKSYNQCQREARSLGYNLNDEADIYQANLYISRCQHGEHVRVNAYNEAIPHRGDREYRREREVAQRRRPEIDRRVLAQAEPKYRPYGVQGFDFCRDLGTLRAERFSDEAGNGNQWMEDCMKGKIRR